MFPGFSDQAFFSFSCPSEVSAVQMKPVEERSFKFTAPNEKITQLNINAKLKYRKIDQFLVNYLFGEDSGITTPVTIISEDQKTVRVIAQDEVSISYSVQGKSSKTGNTHPVSEALPDTK